MHLSEDLFVAACAYYRAAVLVALEIQRAGEDGYISPLKLPAWHLTAMSVELNLKAAFVELGGSQTLLSGKGGMGHDLQRAYDLATRQGFVPPSKFTAVLVQKLRETHRNHTMRYLPSDVEIIEMPRLGDALKAVERLIDSVAPLIYPNGPLEGLQS